MNIWRHDWAVVKSKVACVAAVQEEGRGRTRSMKHDWGGEGGKGREHMQAPPSFHLFS